MPITFGAGEFYMYNADGCGERCSPVRVGKVEDVPTFVCDGPEVVVPEINLWWNKSFTVRFEDLKRSNRRRLLRMAYGWTAKGPIRKRALRRLRFELAHRGR